MGIRVLFVSSSISLASGATHSLFALASGMRNLGVTPIVVFRSHCEASRWFTNEGIDTVVVPFKNSCEKNSDCFKRTAKSLVNAIAEERIYRLVENNKIDLIHINGSNTYVGAKAAQKAGIPYIVHFREFLESDLGFRYSNPKSAEKYMAGAAATISVSCSVGDYAKRRFGLKNNHAIYNGVKIPSTFPMMHQVDSVPTFTIIGRLIPQKGQLEAVEALALLKECSASPFRLQIVGISPYGDYLEKICNIIVSAGLDQSVVFFDHQNDLEEIWAATDVGLVCSKNEAFGRVTAEFMAHSIPVVGADSGGTHELLADGRGLLYKPGSSEDLKNKIVELMSMNNDKKQQMLNDAYKFVKKNCSEVAYVHNVLKVYQDVLDHYEL